MSATFTPADAERLLRSDVARAADELARFRAQRAGHPCVDVDANRAAWAPLAAVPSWPEDPLGPARGVLLGLVLGAATLAGIVAVVWRIVR